MRLSDLSKNIPPGNISMSEGSPRGNKCCHSPIALSVSRKNRIRCEIRRRASQDCAEIEDDSRVDHAHEQHERHHATHWRSFAHLTPRFLHGYSTEGELGCAPESRRIF